MKLAVLILAGALVATVGIAIRDFPLWRQPNDCLLPLPLGEGWGEGLGRTPNISRCVRKIIRLAPLAPHMAVMWVRGVRPAIL